MAEAVRRGFDAVQSLAATLTYDELVDMERALARHGSHIEGCSTALDAVETLRQLMDRDDPHAWNHHLGQHCDACEPV